MKQKLLLKTMLLLCALIAGSSSVWADNYDYNFSSGGVYNSTSNPTTCTWTTSYFTILQEKGASTATAPANNLTAPRWYQNNTVTITPAADVTITGIVITYSGTYTGGTISYPTSQSLTHDSNKKTQTWSGSITSSTPLVLTMGAQCRPTSFAITYTSSASVAAPTFSPTAGTYTSSQNVTLACTTAGATIRYTTDGTDPTNTSSIFSTEVPITPIAVTSTTTIKAKAFKGGDASTVASATYTILPVTHAGTEADPFTVADARNALTADAIDAGTDYYVTGYVAQKSSISSGSLSYYLSDDGGMTSTIQCYKGKYIDGANFTDANAPAVGDVAVVKGKLTIYNSSTYQFSAGNQVVSITPQPTITVTKSSLSDIDYVIDNGPSDTQTFSVSGTTLTGNITLSLGGSSNFEMSLAEGSGYTNELSLTPTTSTVAATTIYVRLKAGLAINSYNGTITLSSTGALDKSVSLTGSVTPPFFAFDLSTDNTAAATATAMTWIGTPAVMGVAKGSAGTATNNYYPSTPNENYTSTRFYKNSILTITPISGYTITSVVFDATTEGYATSLKNSTWTNATASSSSTVVTVTPTSGTSAISATIGNTCGFTDVKVYYTGTTGATETVSLNVACTDGAKYYGTYSTSKAFVVPTDMMVSEISVIDGQLYVEEYNAGSIVPANTGVMVSSATSGDHDVFVASGGTSVLGSDNMLHPSGDAGISKTDMRMAHTTGTKFYRLTMHNGTQLGFYWGEAGGDAFNLAANKAYLAVPPTTSAPTFFELGGDATGINAVNGSEFMVNGEYYNLAGQRVAQPTKGLYIVNGKKVVIK